MKKNILVIATTAILSTLIMGCASSTEPKAPISGECVIDGSSAPKWVCGTLNHDKDTYSDVGSAKLSVGGYNFTRTVAITNARAALSSQIEVLVKAKTENFMRSTGLGSSETIDKVSSSVTKQVSKNVLVGSTQEAMWQGKTELFILVSIPKKSVLDTAKLSVKTSLRNENALWQQFQAKQSLDNLDKEFE